MVGREQGATKRGQGDSNSPDWTVTQAEREGEERMMS